MTVQAGLEEKYARAAGIIARAGMVPFQVTPTLVEIVKFYLDESDADFIVRNYSGKTTLSADEIRSTSGMTEGEIVKKTDSLAKKGIIFNQPNTKGVMVYRLLPLIIVGTFEYTFMNELPKGERLKDLEKIAKLYQTLLGELQGLIQKNYDNLLPIFQHQPPIDRTVPTFTNGSGKTINIIVNEPVKADEHIVPSKTVEEIIAKYDDIAVGHCFCRNYTKVLGHTCVTHAPAEVCFTFGKSARHTIGQGFARRVTKEEAMKIMGEVEEAGLVHKAFHNNSNIEKEENSICNCCKDCCDTFTLWRNGASPMINSTMYLSVIDAGACTGCGICVERCPVDAIALNESGVAVREEAYCIGCGVCARFCPADAISLREGMRRGCVPPPRLRN
jgi:formate hydrogenlyase subunit 6/NADH:ubiquinone oxidoreductase subunit I